MDKRKILASINFGERVAEEETDVLIDYFVETDHWQRLYGGSVDIVYGPKGSGKSALYSLLLANIEHLQQRNIVLIAAENLRGATAFRNLATDPPATEKETIGLWKLYVLSLVQSAFSDHDIRSDAALQVTTFLEREGLIKGKVSLTSLLRAVGSYVSRAMRPQAVEGGIEIDPLSHLPKGFNGKITFSEPEHDASAAGYRSVDSLLRLAATTLNDARLCVWIVLDRLDVAFADTPELEANALRALFRVYLDLMELRSLRLKVFLRSDIWSGITAKGFREASHITRHLTIEWTRSSLLNLVVRRLLHNPEIQAAYGVTGTLAERSVEEQERFIYRIFPETIETGAVEATMDWLFSRLRDGTKATMPREVIHFLNCARELQIRKLEIGELDLEGQELFSRGTFRDVLPGVSKVRLEQTLYAEHPNLRLAVEMLRGAKTLQTTLSLADLWAVPADEAKRRCSTLVDVGVFELRGTPQHPQYWVPFIYSKALGMIERVPDMASDLAHRLRQYLTPRSPMGPSDAAQINDVVVAAKLFDAHNRAFGALLRRDLSVVTGRRGSGKTALLNSYRYREYLRPGDTPKFIDIRSDFNAYDMIIEVATYKHFDDMQRIVASDEARFRPIEAVVDDWNALITDYVFATLVGEDVGELHPTSQMELLRAYLRQDGASFREDVRRLVWGTSLWDKIRAISPSILRRPPTISRHDALEAAVEHLKIRGRRAVVLLDSMDEYDTDNAVFSRNLGGLMRFVSRFNAEQGQIRIKVGLPLEILPEIQRASANPLKDFVAVDHIEWEASELAQIAAYRYRLFLELYDPDSAAAIVWLDLSKRGDVWEFWSRFFNEELSNEYGVEEEPLTYVLRHTQLLPRQFLMILEQIIIRSHKLTGGYREFKSRAVAEAIEAMEPKIAIEIIRAFGHVYPQAETLCKPVFANFPTVFSYEQLEDRWRKKGRAVARVVAPELDTPQFCEMLVRMGIVGIARNETKRYFEGEFGYDSLDPTNIGDGHQLCLHPIFSKKFNAAGNVKRKAIIPKGVVNPPSQS